MTEAATKDLLLARFAAVKRRAPQEVSDTDRKDAEQCLKGLEMYIGAGDDLGQFWLKKIRAALTQAPIVPSEWQPIDLSDKEQMIVGLWTHYMGDYFVTPVYYMPLPAEPKKGE